jgi:hypothetical protein
MLNYYNKIKKPRLLEEMLLLACKGYIISRVMSLSHSIDELRRTSKDQAIKLENYF